MQQNFKDWTEKKKKEGPSKPSKKKAVLWIIQPNQVKQQVTSTIKILMWTHHYGAKQEVLKRKILECVRIGDKLSPRIQTKKWREK